MAYVGTLRDLLPGNLGNVASEVLTFTDAWTWSGATVHTGAFTPTGAFDISGATVTYRALVNADVGAGAVIAGSKLATPARVAYAKGVVYNLDNITIGTAVDGTEIAAATAYENSKAIGTTTAVTIASGAVAADAMITVRHTGVASAAAGEAFVQIEYTVDD